MNNFLYVARRNERAGVTSERGTRVGQRLAAPVQPPKPPHSTVTLFAKLRGLSTSVPFTNATW